jgi:hypothetical protein
MSTNANSALKKMPIYNAFDRFEGYWIKNGNRVRNTDDSYTPPVRYWSSIRNGASELFNRDAVPGVDYALSEIVHCKSRNEVGVQEALNQRAGRYLMKLLSCSRADVLVLVGRKTLNYWNLLGMESSLPRVPDRDGTDPQQIAGRERRVVFLPAPLVRSRSCSAIGFPRYG